MYLVWKHKFKPFPSIKNEFTQKQHPTHCKPPPAPNSLTAGMFHKLYLKDSSKVQNELSKMGYSMICISMYV